ncbi:hypothetical protein AVHY2522_08980 [Acidovorax sp. SUPP2522]|uniref:hypothetical protein n=1 Tax=unclassified Acidovorax TaxID=2684926 RepID=UPI00234A5771|nr:MULTISPECIES: hypothetical protein [unclassified Acidovorax]WCM97069.1 hypothetical protein M5C96_22105 [Acidovorax sp. GBBC 1281]GKT15686.1 hypothetical protein AVHY2522_08980 [Acidovorax sp. SUPP2522]
MRKNMKRLAAISVIGIIAVVVTLKVTNEVPESTPAHVANGAHDTASSQLEITATVDESRQKPSEIPSKNVALSAQILSRYNDSKDLREFVIYAMKHPELGGTYYAVHALSQCKSVVADGKYFKQVQTPYSADKTNSDYTSISKSADILRAQCANFITSELSDSRIAEVKSEGVQKKDPLLIAERNFLEKINSPANNKEEQQQNRKSALTQLLATQDPMVIEDIGPRIALQVDPDTGVRGYKFNDHFYPLASDTDVGLAIYLLPCGLGLNCNSTEFDVASRCASGVECSDSRMDYVKSMLKEKPGAYEKVIKVYEEMINAIARENVSSFL